MSIVVGCVGQKGGVGKTTLARLVAREYARAGWSVKIADLDPSQATNVEWKRRRDAASLDPEIPVETHRTVQTAVRQAGQWDLLVLDGPPHSTRGTLAIARTSHLCLLPTGLSLDDLAPTVRLAHELSSNGCGAGALRVVFNRSGDSQSEIKAARRYIDEAGYSAYRTVLPERAAYRNAADEGKSPAETHFPTLRKRAESLAQEIIDDLERITRGE